MFNIFKKKCPVCKMTLEENKLPHSKLMRYFGQRPKKFDSLLPSSVQQAERYSASRNKEYPEGYGKRFCSENCKEEYRKVLVKEQSKSSHGCCH